MTTKETQRLKDFASRLSDRSNSEKQKSISAAEAPVEPHRPHGERGDFLKVTATLSPEVYELLSAEMLRRKLARQPNAQLSAILREAVVAYLGPKPDKGEAT